MPKPVLHAALLALLVSGSLRAQSPAPYLVKDVNQTAPENVGSFPLPLGTAGGRAVFVTENNQIWASDGTPGGTQLLKDLPPIRGWKAKDGETGLRVLQKTGGRLFLLDKTDGTLRLLVTDGTPAGTVYLANGARLPTTQNSVPSYYWSESLRLFFFSAYDAEHGLEPWVSDGTPAGTHLLRDIRPGSDSSRPGYYTALGSKVFFQAVGKSGYFWRTDGTSAGTSVVPGSEKLYGVDFISIGRKVVFLSYGKKTLELWATDGTREGNQLLKISGAGEDWDVYFLGAISGRVYFYSYEGKTFRLWTSDGTPAGTRALGRFPVPTYAYGSPRSLGFLPNGIALFFLDDGIHGMEWWRSDGTVAGTRLLKDANPGPNSSYWFLIGRPVLVGNKLFVHLGTSTGGEEPWVSDGTAAGTRQIADLCPGQCSSRSYLSSSRFAVGNLEIFSAKRETGDPEIDLWRTDGTPAGTFRLIQSQHAEKMVSLPGIALGNQLLFDADDGVHGLELWATDGTVAGTRLVADLAGAEQAGSAPSQITAVGDRVFFVADDGVHGEALWVTNGTAGGTSLVHALVDPPTGFSVSLFSHLVGWKGRLIFALRESTEISRLWASDGTAQGTQPIGTTVPRYSRTWYMPLGNRLLFPAPDGLWATDGTSGGTTLVTTRAHAEGSDYLPPIPQRFAALGDSLLFAAHGLEGVGLWKTDGTDAGTVLVKALTIEEAHWVAWGGKVYFRASGPDGSGLYESDGTAAGTRYLDLPVSVFSFTVANSRFFLEERLGTKIALWVSDGTAAGTHKLTEVEPGLMYQTFGDLKPAGNQIFFVASDALHGSELWRSDGTVAGTFMVQDINPGPWGSIPDGLVVAGGVAYFNAYDGQHGMELWRSDGTRNGTFRIGEINPGAHSANPQELTVAGPRLFFNADDGAHGFEPWALCLDASCSSAP
jgi:ELWxxDGT repeat protein